MEKSAQTPALRFAGFTDPWEQRKLSDLADTRRGLTYKPSDICENGIRVLRSSNINEDQFITGEDDVFVNANAVNIPFAKKEDILITSANGSSRLVGKHAVINNISDNSTVHGGFMLLASAKIPYFVNASMSSLWYSKFINQFIAGGNGAIGNLNKNDLDGQVLLVPSESEQKKIGAYFYKLDTLITLYQRKVDKLIKVKKSMLENMFPQENENVPKIRFTGFTAPWKQRKLGDIYQNIGNAFVGTATPYYVQDGHFYLESNNVKDGQINHKTEIFINDEFYEKQKDKWLHTGDMVMVQSGHVGHAAVISEELNNTAAHALITFKNPKTKIDPYFLNYQYQTIKARKKIDDITTGNTIKHILASDMQEFVVDIPSYDEQAIIADYFRKLDNLITLHQQKLEKLKNIKKSMLEKMFV